jgi:predicted Zn-dependent peptidase
MKIDKFEISGSKIAAHKISGVRMVSVSVVIKAGSWYENEKQSGYFHLLEHLILSGTKKFKTYRDIVEYKEKYGISSNAATSRSWMEFWYDFPDIYLKESLELIKEVLFSSTVSFENIDNELSTIEQEYLDSWSDPYKKFFVETEKRLAGEKCSNLNEVLGRPETFKKATRDELTKLYKKFFRPERMFWGISGNINIKELKKILNELIPERKNNLKNIELTVENFHPKMGKLVFKNKVEQAYIRIIWQVPLIKSLSQTKRYSLDLFSYLLGGGSNSDLFIKIRRERGLVYRINSTFWDFPNVSYLEIYGSTDHNKIDNVLTESQRVLSNLVNNPIEKERFDRAMNFLDLKTIMSFSSPAKIASTLSFSFFNYGNVYTPKKMNEMAHKMNVQATQKWLKKYLNPKKQLTAVMVSNESS